MHCLRLLTSVFDLVFIKGKCMSNMLILVLIGGSDSHNCMSYPLIIGPLIEYIFYM